MSQYDQLLLRILRGRSDANIRFDELCQLLRHLGFEERIRGSHHIFRKPGITEKINLQRDKAVEELNVHQHSAVQRENRERVWRWF
ncbi:MAG: type II toxin-antitoxin system HicA family toxin [Nitrospinae bacterium]|nr:type II toxin-antitoxin system HicA family toxin [Nitrospinota bacterium]